MKLAIIGCGVSAVTLAIYLKRLDKQNKIEITMFEKESKILKKLLQTGNGKCNILNSDLSSQYYNNQEFMDSVIEKVSLNDMISFIESNNIILKETDSRFYPHSEQALSVYNALSDSLNKSNVKVKLNSKIDSIKRENNNFLINDEVFNNVVIAIGSSACVKDFSLNVLDSLKIKYNNLESGLCGLYVKENINCLQGVRCKCKITLDNTYTQVGEVIFKNDSVNGICVMNLSRYVKEGSILEFDFVHDLEYSKIVNYIKLNKNLPLEKQYSCFLPVKLSSYLASHNIELLKGLKKFQLTVKQKYEPSLGQINLGGVKLNKLDESYMYKDILGLYTIGEIVDIDGECGGYNLYHAMASGIIASRKIYSTIK